MVVSDVTLNKISHMIFLLEKISCIITINKFCCVTPFMNFVFLTISSSLSLSEPSSLILPQKETGSGHTENAKILPQSVIALFESQWSTLQMVVLREILLSAIRAGDPLAAWSAAARLLRSYYPLITPAAQNGLASALSNSADRLPSGTRSADPALPFIRSFPLHPFQG